MTPSRAGQGRARRSGGARGAARFGRPGGTAWLGRAGRDAVTARAATAGQLGGLEGDGAGLQGIRILPLAASVAVGLSLLLVPVPAGLPAQGWHLLAIFLSTIAGLVLQPIATGAWAFLALTFSIVSGTLSWQGAFYAFTNEVIWLIVISFFFAQGFVKTGLGERVATFFVKVFGKSTLGLSYGLNLAETLIGPAMPSSTARAGGIFVPIITSLSKSNGSEPNDPSCKRMGAFLIQSQLQTSAHGSALFFTAAAQNLMCLKIAEEFGVTVTGQFLTWLVAASVPAVVSLVAVPWLVYLLYPPEVTSTPEAPAAAAKKLQAMGPMSTAELIMAGTMGGAIVLWVAGETIGISAAVTAMLGLCVLLCSGVVQWKDCLSETGAWDTLLWFSVLIGMSGQLNSLGVIGFFADSVANALSAANLGWVATFCILQVAYYAVHYIFASQTAHVGALYAAFLGMLIAAGCPPVLSALVLGLNTNLLAGITPFASGHAAVYAGSGYVPDRDFLRLGAIFSVFNLAIWLIIGLPWWKFLGYF